MLQRGHATSAIPTELRKWNVGGGAGVRRKQQQQQQQPRPARAKRNETSGARAPPRLLVLAAHCVWVTRHGGGPWFGWMVDAVGCLRDGLGRGNGLVGYHLDRPMGKPRPDCSST